MMQYDSSTWDEFDMLIKKMQLAHARIVAAGQRAIASRRRGENISTTQIEETLAMVEKLEGFLNDFASEYPMIARE